MRRNATSSAVLVAAAVLATAAAGCEGGDGAATARTGATAGASSSSGGATPSSATTASRTTPTTAGPTGDTGEGGEGTGVSELEDGRHFGYWRTFEIGDATAFGEFDLAYFLTGAEAEAAAAERGDEVDNDYYVVNDNPRLRTLVVGGNADVLVLAGEGAELEPSNVADFAADRRLGSGFWVTIEGGVVTEIEEQYVP